MARKIRAPKIDTRSSRLALPAGRKSHGFTSIAPGMRLGYRRNKRGAGTWVLAVADGKGGEWQARVGTADDFEDSDGNGHVLTYFEAIERARKMARGQTDESSRPVTWAMALDLYERDLIARNGDPTNARRVRHHLTPTLLTKPVALLTAHELRRWRDVLIESVSPETVVRTLKAAKASLNLAADLDPARIPNRNAWRVGLSGLTDSYTPVNKVRSDAECRALVEGAYALDPYFGLVVDVLASTGTRTSQACALLVGDLQADRVDPRLMMPSSRKGKKRHVRRVPVPISVSLARKLKRAAGNRDPSDPLLTRSDGSSWDPKRQELQNLFAEVARCTGIGGTAYQLRHSSIVRSLLVGTPVRLTASLHDTSTAIIERVYSAFIADHGDAQARRGLLDTESPASANVVPLPGRRSS